VFWETYSSALPREAEWIESATVGHLGCLLLARIDGKSPVEYLQDTELQERVREFARALILDPPTTVAGVFTRL
jgi:5-methylthioribose kinase